MAPSRLKIGRRNVVASGSIVLSKTDTSFSIGLDGFEILFTFAAGPEPQVQAQADTAQKVSVTLKGFSQPLPVFWHHPEIAQVNGKPLEVAVAVTAASNGDIINRSVSYTLSSEGADAEV